MWYVCDVLYAVLYVCVCCFVVCGCTVSRRYIDVCYCDMFSVVNVYPLVAQCPSDDVAHVLFVSASITVSSAYLRLLITLPPTLKPHLSSRLLIIISVYIANK